MDKFKIAKLGHITTRAAQNKLFVCKTILPWDYYKVTLDEAKVTIMHRQWFVKHIVTVQLPDLLNVEITVGPIFGCARIFSKYVTGGEMTVPWFWKKDALKLRARVNAILAEMREGAKSTAGRSVVKDEDKVTKERNAAVAVATSRLSKDVVTKLDEIIKTAEDKLSIIYEENRTGKSDKWYEARHAYDILAQTLYDIKQLKRPLSK